MAKDQDMSSEELSQLIGKVMPLALQLTMEKNVEPTFRNILQLVATNCHEWFLSMTEMGTYVNMSTGWLFVPRTNTEIVDKLSMDEAILHSLRCLAPIQPAVSLQDLYNYVSAAFSLPKSLSAGDVFDKVRCSVESMRIWGRVLAEDGGYKLPSYPVVNDLQNINEAQAQIGGSSDASPELVPDHIFDEETVRDPVIETTRDAVNLPVENTCTGNPAMIGTEEGELLSSESSSESESSSFSASKRNKRVRRSTSSIDQHRGSTASSVESSNMPYSESITSGMEANGVHCSLDLFVTIKAGPNKANKFSWSLPLVRSAFLRARLPFGRIFMGRNGKPYAFVEVKNAKDGNLAIKMLNGKMQKDGAFSLIVKWAVGTIST